MILGAVKETFPGERRVAIVPASAGLLIKSGCEIHLEAGAGLDAGYPDSEYADKGVRIVDSRQTVLSGVDVLAQVRGLGANPEHGKADLGAMRSGQSVIASFEPLTAHAEVRAMAEKGVSLFALELVPRITRAQSMDVLSSMATIAGYKAVLLAANHLPKMFPMMMTAAGTVAPARVLIVGAGVAGLQAIASSKRMGAQVYAYDIRSAVKEQIESLGAKFVEMDLDAGAAETKGGYAKDMGDDFLRRQQEMMTKVVAESDVVITTAAIPGKKAPVIVSRDMVHAMHTGSVIIDIAAERGGNCEVTVPGEIVQERGVTVVGPTNLAATIPYHASQMYAKNVSSFLGNMMKDGDLAIDLEDEVVAGTLVTHEGRIVHPMVLERMNPAPESSN